MSLAALKSRLIAYNERGQNGHQDETARQQAEEARRGRDEAVREVAERIAAAILASAPPPRAHSCEQPAWCLWCAPSSQARIDAEIARGIGGAE